MDFLAGQQVLLAGDHADGSATNDVATATADAAVLVNGGARGRLILLGVTASFSAGLAAIATITVTYTRPGAATTNSITIPYDFTAGAFFLAFPAPLTTERGTSATATLTAGGGGNLGRVTLWYCQT